MKKSSLLAFIIIILTGLVGCTPEPIHYRHDNTELNENENIKLELSNIPAGLNKSDYSWSVNYEDLFKVDTDGILTGISGGGGYAYAEASINNQKYIEEFPVKIIGIPKEFYFEQDIYTSSIDKQRLDIKLITDIKESDLSHNSIQWESSDPTIARVDARYSLLKKTEATVFLNAAGTVAIKATLSNITTECVVDVTASEKPGSVADGETLFAGTADFKQAEAVRVSFILTADKDEIRDIRIEIPYLEVSDASDNNGSITHTRSVTNKIITYEGNWRTNGGAADINFDGNSLIFTLDGNTAEGTIDYTYVFEKMQTINGIGGSPELPVELGAAIIIFTAQ